MGRFERLATSHTHCHTIRVRFGDNDDVLMRAAHLAIQGESEGSGRHMACRTVKELGKSHDLSDPETILATEKSVHLLLN